MLTGATRLCLLQPRGRNGFSPRDYAPEGLWHVWCDVRSFPCSAFCAGPLGRAGFWTRNSSNTRIRHRLPVHHIIFALGRNVPPLRASIALDDSSFGNLFRRLGWGIDTHDAGLT